MEQSKAGVFSRKINENLLIFSKILFLLIHFKRAITELYRLTVILREYIHKEGEEHYSYF